MTTSSPSMSRGRSPADAPTRERFQGYSNVVASSAVYQSWPPLRPASFAPLATAYGTLQAWPQYSSDNRALGSAVTIKSSCPSWTFETTTSLTLSALASLMTLHPSFRSRRCARPTRHGDVPHPSHCSLSVQLCIGGLIDLSHAALTNEGGDVIVAELGTDC